MHLFLTTDESNPTLQVRNTTFQRVSPRAQVSGSSAAPVPEAQRPSAAADSPLKKQSAPTNVEAARSAPPQEGLKPKVQKVPLKKHFSSEGFKPEVKQVARSPAVAAAAEVFSFEMTSAGLVKRAVAAQFSTASRHAFEMTSVGLVRRV